LEHRERWIFLCEVSLSQYLEQSVNLSNVRENQDAEEGAAAATRIHCLVLHSANTMQGIV